MNGTWWLTGLLAVTALAGCGSPDEAVEGDGLGKDVPVATATPSSSPEPGLDRLTPPTGECGVTLICGLGAGPEGPMTP